MKGMDLLHDFVCLCFSLAQCRNIFASVKKNAMRNTEFTIENLASAISSESSLSALVEMIGDMGLEITDMAVSLK